MAEKSQSKAGERYQNSKQLLDALNIAILRALTEDARLSMSALARRVGLSPPAVTERVQRLEEAGVIRGYRADINPAAVGLPVAAWVRIRPGPGQLMKVAELAAGLAEVVECHRITGDDCFLIKVHVAAVDQLETVLDRFLLYGQTNSSVVQSSPVPPRPVPLPSPRAA
jgi:Lrp/AsnC family transcriptional regulator, leucine-responsive regulatory protein